MTLIKGFEKKSMLQEATENVLRETKEGKVLETSFDTKFEEGNGYFDRGFFRQALKGEKGLWKGYARDKFNPNVTFETPFLQTERETMQMLDSVINIYLKGK